MRDSSFTHCKPSVVTMLVTTIALLFLLSQDYCRAEVPSRQPGLGKISGRFSVNKPELTSGEIQFGKVLAVLEPLQEQPLVWTPKVHHITMMNKTFQPSRLVVHPGDTVEFKNTERFRHNAFSLSPGNQFDAGMIEQGERGTITFKSPGLVKIYCNVHREMAAYVLVTSQGSPLSIDEQGNFESGNLPAGQYDLTVWDPMVEGKERLNVAEGAKRVPEVVLKARDNDEASHPNKWGVPYSTVVISDVDKY